MSDAGNNTPKVNGQDLYEFAVVRYVPRIERGEFVNIGLLMMNKRRRWMRFEAHLDAARLAVFDCPHTPQEIEAQLKTFADVAAGKVSAGPMAALPVEERFRWLTAVKSACLQTSRPHPGIAANPDAAFRRLFAELVL